MKKDLMVSAHAWGYHVEGIFMNYSNHWGFAAIHVVTGPLQAVSNWSDPEVGVAITNHYNCHYKKTLYYMCIITNM